jgi:hypothetical protein
MDSTTVSPSFRVRTKVHIFSSNSMTKCGMFALSSASRNSG